VARGRLKSLIIFLIFVISGTSLGFKCFAQCGGIDFSAFPKTKGCALLSVTFNAKGTPAGIKYDWNLGNGFLTGKKDTITGIYSNGGKYTVIMRAHLPNGDTCRVQKDTFITVIPKPVPNLKIYPDTLICDITRTVTFIDSTPNITSRQWVIEGNSYSNSLINYKFFKPGEQDITLSLTNNFGCSSYNTKHVYVYDSLPVDFCADITINDTTNISATFSPDIVNPAGRNISGYYWSFPGGYPSSSTLSNPTVTYINAKKKYKVMMTVYTTDGCGYTMSRDGFIQPFITPLFANQCIGKTTVVSAIGATSGTALNYQFSFLGAANVNRDNNDITGSTYDVLYDDAGNYGMSFQFSYKNPSKPALLGCPIKVTYLKYISILGPRANFTSNDNQICAGGDTVHFINTSNLFGATKVMYTWYVQNSHNGKIVKMGPTPTMDTFYVLTDTGFSYNVILVAKSANGCQDSIFNKGFITTGAPKADFTVLNASTCFNSDPIVLVAKPTPPEQPDVANYAYYWVIQSESDVNDITQAYTNVVFFSPKNVGKYDVFIKIANAHCYDTLTKFGAFNVLGDETHIIATDTLGCLNPDFKTTFTVAPEKINPPNANIVPFYKWKVSNVDSVAQSPYAIISSPNASKTDIRITKGSCYNVSVYIGIVFGNDTCIILYTKLICVGVHVDFSLEPFKTDSTDHPPVSPKPWKCIGDTITVTNTTDRGANSFKWTVTPPGFTKFIPNDHGRDVKLVFEKDTCYIVKCVATMFRNNLLCSDSAYHYECLIGPKPNFTSASPTIYCAPAIVNFKNLSPYIQNGYAGDTVLPSKLKNGHLYTHLYLWDFGDGSTLFTKNDTAITHVYQFQQKNSYTVTLTAFDTDFTYLPACSNTITKTGFVKVTGPVPGFSMSKKIGCDSLFIDFVNTSSKVNKFYFFYDDGTDVDSISLKPHFYSLQDTSLDSVIYNPTILSRDDTACKVFYRDTIKIYKTPINTRITADINNGCAPLRVHFNAISSSASSWLWDFDNDGRIDDSVKSPYYTFKKPGKYRVKLNVKNHGSCPVTIYSDTINVVPNATAKFELTANKICGRQDIGFKNLSTDFNRFMINYGDSSAMDSNVIIKHSYYFDSRKTNADSIRLVPELIVFNVGGCSDTAWDTLTVYQMPLAGFRASVEKGCSPMKVHFTDTSKNSFGAEWDFNNDGVADAYGKEVDWTYYPGIYTVKLRSFTIQGCVDSVVKVNLIVVNDPPKADFSLSDSIICYKGEVKFTNLTQPIAYVKSYFWNFGDTAAAYNTNNVKNPVFRFFSIGNHIVTLWAIDDKGCIGIKKRDIIVVDTTTLPKTSLDYVTVNDTSSISISWGKNRNPLFKAYRISRLTSSAPVIIYTGTNENDTSYTDTDPKLNSSASSYCYVIQTLNSCGQASIVSQNHCTILLNEIAVPGPANILNWSAYIGWKPKYYRIYRSDAAGKMYKIDSVNVTSYTDSALCDETYCYYVEAVSDSGYISKSNITCLHAQYQKLNIPLNLRYVTDLNNSGIKMEWDTSGYKYLDEYAIDKYIPGIGWQTNYGVSKSNSFTDNKVDISNISYTYSVRAIDKCGYENPASNLGTSILLNQKINNDNVALSWNGYHNWKNGVRNYILQVQRKDKSFKTIASISDTFYTDDSVYNSIDTAYCYRVIAYENAPGNDSSISNRTCAILPSRVFVPNAFTPGNNDSLNDIWKVSSLSIYNAVGQKIKSYNARVFNRWGTLVFETNDLNIGWNGNFRGKPVPLDVYLYLVDAEGIDGREIHLRGSLTLVK